MWMFWALKLGFNIDILVYFGYFFQKIGEIVFYFLVTLVLSTVTLRVNYAQCHLFLVVEYKPFLLNVVMLSVIRLNVVAPGEVSLSP